MMQTFKNERDRCDLLDKNKAVELLQTIKNECIQIEKSCKECAFHKSLGEDIFCPFGYMPERWQL